MTASTPLWRSRWDSSPRRYTSFQELKNDPPAYDVYVAGSDQIWNPFIYADKQFEPAFLLDFVREGRKISYAPSLATPTLPPPYNRPVPALSLQL